MANKDFRIAIVGGGMCGLACAVGLANLGIQAEAFESAPKFDEVGAGVGLGPNALRALKGLGVLDAVLALGDAAKPTGRRMFYLSGGGNHEEVYDYNNSSQFTSADDGIGIYRPAFLNAVLPLVDSKRTHFDKRCTAISAATSGTNVLHFADGTTHEADLIIGADGIRSVVREAVAGTEKVLQFTNTVAYRGLVPTAALQRDGVKTDLTKRLLCFVGIDKHIITFPINSGKTINIVAFATNSAVPVGSVDVPGPWVESVPQQELLDAYAGWGPDVQIMLQHLVAPSKWYIHALRPLPTYVRGRIALVGDAAHAMPPHLGSGVGQGFEDVFTLCRLLAHPSTKLSNLEDVLRAYDAVRQPHANMVLERSFRAGEIFEGYGKPGYQRGDMSGHLEGIWEPIWWHDLDGEVTAAVTSLTQQGVFSAS
ncbi:hypothetical protein C8J57DRAFT_1316692 [Mycena rebaudengoi]|nr:hypothetical protein C8J57DRAFT_1316692 [Mycena rebaudengoi]